MHVQTSNNGSLPKAWHIHALDRWHVHFIYLVRDQLISK